MKKMLWERGSSELPRETALLNEHYATSLIVTQARSHADTWSARGPQGPAGSQAQKNTQAHWLTNS